MAPEGTLGITERLLNAWASARHHRMLGGEGHPRLSDTHRDPREGATPLKYEHRQNPRVDIGVTAAIETVDRALTSCHAPDWFVVHLLATYPTVGRYAPPPVANVHAVRLTGGLGSEKIERSVRQLVRATERAFTKVLLAEAANLSPSVRARCAREDSRRRSRRA